MKRPSRRQIIIRRRVIVSISLSLVFGMGAVAQKKFYKSKYQAPVIAFAQNRESDEGYKIDKVEVSLASPSIDGVAYVTQRAYQMYNDHGIRTIDINGEELFIGLEDDIPNKSTVHEVEVSGNRVRIIIKD